MSSTNNPNFRKIAAWIAAGCFASAAFTGCCGHLPIPSLFKHAGRVVSVKEVNGPLCDGELGSIKVAFRGELRPPTRWWLDSAVPPHEPGSVFPVKPCGETVTGFNAGTHIIFFSGTKFAPPPPPKKIGVSTSKTTVVTIKYR